MKLIFYQNPCSYHSMTHAFKTHFTKLLCNVETISIFAQKLTPHTYKNGHSAKMRETNCKYQQCNAVWRSFPRHFFSRRPPTHCAMSKLCAIAASIFAAKQSKNTTPKNSPNEFSCCKKTYQNKKTSVCTPEQLHRPAFTPSAVRHPQQATRASIRPGAKSISQIALWLNSVRENKPRFWHWRINNTADFQPKTPARRTRI